MLATRLSRFAIVGGISTAVHTAVAFVLITAFSSGAVLGNVLAAMCAAAVSFVLNTLWSFDAEMGLQLGVRYAIVVLGGFAATAALSYLVVDVAGLAPLVSIAVVVVVVPGFTFFAHHLWTYRAPAHGS